VFDRTKYNVDTTTVNKKAPYPKDSLKKYIKFNKPAISEPEDLTPDEAKEVLLAYIEYQESEKCGN